MFMDGIFPPHVKNIHKRKESSTFLANLMHFSIVPDASLTDSVLWRTLWIKADA